MFQYKHTARVCEWVHRQFCLCVNRKSTNLNKRLSTFTKLEICHPQEEASVWLIPSENLCQQYSSLFPACGCSYLDHLSLREKTQASLSWPPLYIWEVFQVYSVLRNASSWKSSLTEAVNELKQATSEGLTKTHRQITHEQIQKQPF